MGRMLEGRTILTILMLAFELYVVVVGFGYGPNSRIFPMGIGIPTLVLTIVALVAVWRPGLLRSADASLGGSSVAVELPADEERGNVSYPTVRVLRMIGWLLLALAGIALVGFRVTVPVYILLFARLEGRANWLVCTLIALSCWAFTIGYFELFMQTQLFKGIFFGDTLPLF